MKTTSKLALIVAVAAFGIASPVLAKSLDSGRHAYAMVPATATIAPANEPAATGGGNRGYNEELLKSQW